MRTCVVSMSISARTPPERADVSAPLPIDRADLVGVDLELLDPRR